MELTASARQAKIGQWSRFYVLLPAGRHDVVILAIVCGQNPWIRWGRPLHRCSHAA